MATRKEAGELRGAAIFYVFIFFLCYVKTDKMHSLCIRPTLYNVFETRIVFSMRVFVFWLQAFCKTVLCRFFIWIYRVFKARIVFSMRVFVFWLQAFCKTVLCRFSYDFIGFLRPELFFQWEWLFFWLQAFCKTVLCRFFIWIYRVFKARIVFSMRVFVFLASGIL